MGGDHGLLLKGFMPLRGVRQVPLVIADPRQAPARTDALASSIDIGATLMDLGRVAAHDGIQGRSLAPALKDPRAQVRTSVLIEDDLRTGVAQLLGSPNRVRTVVTEQLKYTRYADGSELLFDLLHDPLEVDDLAHRSDGRLDQARCTLLDALLVHSDEARGAPPPYRP